MCVQGSHRRHRFFRHLNVSVMPKSERQEYSLLPPPPPPLPPPPLRFSSVFSGERISSARGLTAYSSSREGATLGTDAACTADTATARYVAKYDNRMLESM